MAKEDPEKTKEQLVTCAHCGKSIPISKSFSYGEHNTKEWEFEYFCDVACAYAKLFGIIKKSREFLLGLENAR